jgi:Protein of unknown function (DUF4238)
MPANKSQHYVPQFYLRNFSKGDKCIGLYNLRSSKTVEQASIRDQACKDYFYGKDLYLEKRLMDMEGLASRIIRGIINARCLPDRKGDDFRTLCIFVMMQENRTVESVALLNEMFEKVGKAMLSRSIKDPELLKHLPALKIEVNHPFSILLKQAITTEPLIRDLKLKVLHNVSTTPFITSDHPVVMQNQFHANLTDNRSRGLVSEGLQIFLPISPHHALMFYDDVVYAAGSVASNFIRIPSDEQIELLNGHQWIGATSNVYFPEGADMARLARGAATYVPMRRHTRVDVTTTPLEQNGTQRKELLQVSSGANYLARLAACKPRMKSVAVSMQEQFPLRHPEWVRKVRTWEQALAGGHLSFADFWSKTASVSVGRRRRV